MRITDQYFWNVVFLIFFAVLLFLASVVLASLAPVTLETVTVADAVIIIFASMRVVRLVVHDKIFAFFREQFYDVVEDKRGFALVKPPHGPRRTIADLLSCVWCFGVWATAMVAFVYFLTPLALFPLLILALSAVVSLLQIFAQMIGWQAEKLKKEVEGM